MLYAAEQFGSFGGVTSGEGGEFGDMSPREGALSGMSDAGIIESLSAYGDEALAEGRDVNSPDVIRALNEQVLKIAMGLIRGDESLMDHDGAVAELSRLSEESLEDPSVKPEEFCREVGVTLLEIVDMKN